MSDNAKWYVIHTYSGYENRVAANIEKTVENRQLQDYIFEVYVPTENVVEIKDNKKKEVERKVFPGYVLVKMVLTDDSWYVVRNTRGVTGFVGPSSKPTPLTDAEVEMLGMEKQTVTVEYEVGSDVLVIDGALKNFMGIVEELDIPGNLVKVTVLMFGREIPVELELDQVKLANK